MQAIYNLLKILLDFDKKNSNWENSKYIKTFLNER